MKLEIESFRGEAPLVTPRALPANAAQLALNAKLMTGDLQAWRQHLLDKVLANTGTVRTIYKLKDKWLSWNDQVDVARGLIPGDDTFLTYLTCPSLYSRPQFTDYAMATTGAEPFPVATRPLGVDAPLVAPTLAIGVDTSDSATFSVDITDNGDQLPTWSKSGTITEATFAQSVAQDASDGSPAAPCYIMEWRDQENGLNLRKNFGIANAAAVTMTFRTKLNDIAGRSRVWAGVMRTEAGAGISVQLDQGAGWYLSIGTGSSWSQGQDQATLTTSAALVGVAADTWYKIKIDIVRNADNTQTVTATILTTADVVIGTTSTTMTAELGDWCGFGSGFDQLGGYSRARVDDIHVQASGTFGYAPVNTATSYLFTYRNDKGQESAPSPVTSTILRPDGVVVTVTTPTTLPGGYSDYVITDKVIYRAVTGDGGTVFKQVAVVPLATADFVDNLQDQETGPHILESADWALPPAELEGIIALPNDCMAGFFRNQLCFSAQGFPHAWPVKYRKTTDTDIVAINNIDTTVVVGTKSFVYTATGSSPDAYSMSKPGEKQACLAKLGMVYVDEVGVVFPSPDGWQLCQGSAGAVRNLTQDIFEKNQWTALNPASFIAVVNDGVLHWFYDTDVAACDCTVTAWQANFDEPLIGPLEPPMLIGTGAIAGDFGISSTAPLYGTSSLTFSSNADSALTLTAPAVSIVDAWTVNYSVLAESGFFGGGGQLVCTLWSTPSGPSGEVCRLELRNAGAGMEFFFFDATTFNSGSQDGFAYDTLWNVEFSAGGGQLRVFVNGALILSGSSSAGTEVQRITFETVTPATDLTLKMDELRVTNRVEHTADYDVALPFCTCAP